MFPFSKKKNDFDPNYSNKKGQSYLHFFAFDGYLPGIRLYAAAGSDPNKQDRYGLTPLHYATLNGQSMAVIELIKVGAKTDIKDNEGDSPADIARKKYRYDLLKVLEP